MNRRKLRTLIVAVLFVLTSLPNSRADEPADPPVAAAGAREAQVIDEIKNLILAGDWAAAHNLETQFRKDGLPDAIQVNWNQFRLGNAIEYSDDHPMQKRARALAASELGLHALAAEQYELQAKLESSEQSQYNARSDAARSAFRAGREAVIAGDLDRAARYFGKMESLGDSWMKEAGAKKKALVEKLAAAPDDVAVRIEFANAFWIENVPALGVEHEPARKVLIDALALKPTAEQRLQVYQLVQQYSVALNDAPAVDEYAGRIELEFAGAPASAQSAFDRSQFLFKNKKLAEAETTLKKILVDQPGTPIASRALLSLAEISDAGGDALQAERWLIQCVKLKATAPLQRNVMDTDGSRSVAMQRLALRCEQQGRWKEALGWWTQWQPTSWCGTCSQSMKRERETHIAACQKHLAKQP